MKIYSPRLVLNLALTCFLDILKRFDVSDLISEGRCPKRVRLCLHTKIRSIQINLNGFHHILLLIKISHPWNDLKDIRFSTHPHFIPSVTPFVRSNNSINLNIKVLALSLHH